MIRDVTVYGRIVCVFSFGLFLESIWTKVLQSIGDMKTPMIAQILGAVTNIVLDPLLIFGLFGLPEMGIAGAAVATVAGQIVAALVVMRKGFRRSPAAKAYPHHVAKIFRLGIPNILMQSAYTFYIFGLNLILASFCDEAVTALGIYYKWQTFFFIPLGALIVWRYTIQGLGYSTLAMMAGVAEMVARTVIALVLIPVLGYFGAELSNPVAWVAACLFLYPAYLWTVKHLENRLLAGHLAMQHSAVGD